MPTLLHRYTWYFHHVNASYPTASPYSDNCVIKILKFLTSVTRFSDTLCAWITAWCCLCEHISNHSQFVTVLIWCLICWSYDVCDIANDFIHIVYSNILLWTMKASCRHNRQYHSINLYSSPVAMHRNVQCYTGLQRVAPTCLVRHSVLLPKHQVVHACSWC